MYGLSKDLDLSFLNGREVGQVAIGVHEIIFGFDEDVTITDYSQFSYFDGQEEPELQAKNTHYDLPGASRP